ncbi:zona pellucida sperm-binding protein 3-like [Pseudoliparis swirei]|uniref:zona pellucida sperm-binding protein 3-like n=1 Tax=Pseudoliparis swirei TaxID=2059687 RepID=UPI0024BDB319|nr:zona pellucida sperm-binding protein 3-like [Pseudoliparis swirei]
MDCNFSPLWLTVLLSVSTLAESWLASSRGSSATARSLTPSRVRYNQPQTTPGKPQQSAPAHAPPRPVVVNCHPDSMRVVVQADMFDTGLQVDARHLRLGSGSVSEGSECGAVSSGEAEFTIQAFLQDCGTKLSSTKEKIIYSNVLIYSPKPSPDDLLRLNEAKIPVQCHYEKRCAVAAIPLQPTWLPLVSRVSSEDHIDFNLLLMTDDWQFQRGSVSYFLGDPINVEVSAIVGHHMPLRVYVEHCVATATPDAEATLRYDFIEHFGCLADAYLTNSSSHFLPRLEEHKLRFQLEAFRFHQEPSNWVYITCYLRAVPVRLAGSSENRACSLIENRWRSIDGNDQACRSCDASYRAEEPLPTEALKTTISSQARPSKTSPEERPDQSPANYFRFRPGVLHNQQNTLQNERSVQLGPMTVQQSVQINKRASDYKLRSPKNGTT